MKKLLLALAMLTVAGTTACKKEQPPRQENYYAEGDVVLWKESNLPAGQDPVVIVVMGDGFVQNDYAVGGHFDTKADEMLEGLFAVEPYRPIETISRSTNWCFCPTSAELPSPRPASTELPYGRWIPG